MSKVLSAKTLFIVSFLIFVLSLGSGIYFLHQGKKTKENNPKTLSLAELSPNLVSNGDFSIVSKDSSSPPQGWQIYQGDKNVKTKDISYSESISFEKIEESDYTYVNDSSLLVTSKLKDMGFSQDIPKDITLPGFVQANVLVVSGGVKLIVLDKKGNEIESVEVGVKQFEEDETVSTDPTDLWQRLPIRLPVGSSPRKLIAVSTQDNSKYYITNVNVKGNNDLSEYYKNDYGEYILYELTKDCQDIEDGERYKECVVEKIGLDSDQWYEEGDKSNFDQEASGVLGDSTVIMVKKVFFDVNYSGEEIKKIMEKGNSLWQDENVDKQLCFDNAKIEYFDTSVPSKCSRETDEGVVFYIPDISCTRSNPLAGLKYVFVKMGNAGFQIKSTSTVFVGSYKSIDSNDFFHIFKHETGHVFGAPDTDYIEINGNSIFPEGNSKDGTKYDDIMYSREKNHAEEYVENVINATKGVMGGAMGGFSFIERKKVLWGNQINEFKLIEKETRRQIDSGRYKIFIGEEGPNHVPGYIKNKSTFENKFYDGKIILRRNPFRYHQVAAFLMVENDKKEVYVGKFDLIDVSMAFFRGEKIIEVEMVKSKIDFGFDKSQIKGQINLIRDGKFDYNNAVIVLEEKKKNGTYFQDDSRILEPETFLTYDYSIYAPNGVYRLFLNFHNGERWLDSIYYPEEIILENNEIKKLDINLDLRNKDGSFSFVHSSYISSISYESFSDGLLSYIRFFIEGENFSDNNKVCIKELGKEDKCIDPEFVDQDSKHLTVLLEYDVFASLIEENNLSKLTFVVYGEDL